MYHPPHLTMQIVIKFKGGPKDGEEKGAEVTGNPLNNDHMLIYPILDGKGRRVSDHIYRHIGDGVFEYKGQTTVRQFPTWKDRLNALWHKH